MLAELTMAPSTVDENDVLYRRINSGDLTAIEEMIERNVPLVKSRVSAFLQQYRRFSHVSDDLAGEGFLALTRTVNSFVDTATEKPTGRIVFDIDKALGDFVDEEIGAGLMSSRTVRRRRSRNESLPNQLQVDPNNPPRSFWQHADGRVIRKPLPDEGGGTISSSSNPELKTSGAIERKDGISRGDARQIIASHIQPDATPQSELLDEIMACCECDEERMIVELRIKGYKDAEIGEQLELSQQTVNLRRREIERRFNERMAK